MVNAERTDSHIRLSVKHFVELSSSGASWAVLAGGEKPKPILQCTGKRDAEGCPLLTPPVLSEFHPKSACDFYSLGQ